MKKYTIRYKGFKIEKKEGEPYRVAMDYPAKSMDDCKVAIEDFWIWINDEISNIKSGVRFEPTSDNRFMEAVEGEDVYSEYVRDRLEVVVKGHPRATHRRIVLE